MNITLRHLEIFVAVAKYKSITIASEKLYLSQSAISMSIAELEKRLGAKLFDRTGKRLILNNFGESVFIEANFILKKVEELENIFHQKKLTGTLIVGATQTIGNYLLPKIIGFFKKKNKEVEISLIIDNTKNIMEKLLNFEIDVAFVEGIVNNELVDSINWLEDEIVIFSSPDHPLAKKNKISFKDLEKSNWILREKGSGTREIFEREMHNNLKELKIYLEINHIEAIKQIVESGLGIGVLSILTIREAIECNKLKIINAPLKIKRYFKIIIHKKKYRTILLENFMKFSINYVKRGKQCFPLD